MLSAFGNSTLIKVEQHTIFKAARAARLPAVQTLLC